MHGYRNYDNAIHCRARRVITFAGLERNVCNLSSPVIYRLFVLFSFPLVPPDEDEFAFGKGLVFQNSSNFSRGNYNLLITRFEPVW